MVEPFMSRRVDGRAVSDLSTEAIIRSMSIAAALGATSAYTWLKVPVVDDMAPVAEATTLPVVLLGGARADRPDEMFERWQRALALPGVRGLVVGRNLLYPKDDDVVGRGQDRRQPPVSRPAPPAGARARRRTASWSR